jgi:hypothetical protein
MRIALAAASLIWFIHAEAVHAQSVIPEATISAGTSSDNVTAVATELRAFGEVQHHVRYYVEAAWARSSDEDGDSDAFGAAYPYGNRLQVIEAYAERVFRPQGKLVALRAGRFRTPFGIHNASDHAYTGFLRAPLIRYEGYFALSNAFLEHGADLVLGVPWLSIQTSFGAPADVGKAARPSGLDTVVRAQGFYGPLIAGASYIRTLPYQTTRSVRGHAKFTGLDLRWMHAGVQLRGEWITGQPYEDRSTTGWYLDAIVHRIGMGPMTAVARVEKLDYVGRNDIHAWRQTLGTRVRILEGLSAHVNVLHQSGQEAGYRAMPLDVGLSYSRRIERR